MRRLIIFGFTIVLLFFIMAMIQLKSLLFWLLFCIFLLTIVIYDFFQKKHTILRNFPGLGNFRYLLELIRPEIRQYFIASDEEERPFDRETRNIVYQRSKRALDTIPFGTQHDISANGYELAKHSMKPTVILEEETRILVGGPQCKQPYLASCFNISGMSFGAISNHAVMALNRGAKLGNFFQNTGEGGLTEYHLKYGGDLVWQIGTGNFGCRHIDGRFDDETFKEKARHPQVKMIEIKISQGAKPSHGGILPAAKITPEIAKIRHIALGVDCVSPPVNPEFSTPVELLNFIVRLRELSDGKPVGFKLCIGFHYQFFAICKAMLKTGIYPDFINVDGAEGGTGAAPLEFANRLGEPIDDGLVFVQNALNGIGLRDKIRIMGAGKVATGFDLVSKMALGADMCNSARGMMFALGCIQSLQCNRNTCPTGVTTQNPRLVRGLVVEEKYLRVANYHKNTIHSFLELIGAMGINHVSEISPWCVFRRDEGNHIRSYADFYEFLKPNAILDGTMPDHYLKEWGRATPESF